MLYITLWLSLSIYIYIECCKNINEKNKCAFIQLDIKEFYPSVTEDILENAITFAKTFISVTDPDLRIIKHCRRSLLFSKEEVWKIKSTRSCFDGTMGSYDGVEICELVGVNILSHLETILNKNEMGFYHSDGLIILRGVNGQKTDKTSKNIVELFKNIGFKIDIVTNLKEVTFLDVTFNLTNGTFRPHKKPNDKLLYIHTSSNHPPQILKQLPNAINERLSHNLSDEAVFNSTRVEYEDTLKKSGYKVNLKYTAKTTAKPKKNRQRNIIWFNPPSTKALKQM